MRFSIIRGYRHGTQRGGIVVEFALSIPLFLLIVFSVFELGLMLVIKNTLQTGVTAGAVMGSTDSSTPGSARTSAITAYILQKIGGIMNTNNVTITIQSYPSFAAISGTNPANLTTVNPGTAGSGNAGDVVRYQAQYVYTVMVPMVRAIFGTTKTFKAVTVAKNEGYYW